MRLSRIRRLLARRSGASASATESEGGVAIYISYRRRDSARVALLVRDQLAAQLGPGRVVSDVDSIGIGYGTTSRAGSPYTVPANLDSFGMVLALIGPNWNPVSAGGRGQLADPSDHVRIELETALGRRVRVIPVLVDGATLPTADDLPPSLVGLTALTTFQLRNNHLNEDVSALASTLRRFDEAAAGVPWSTIKPLDDGRR